MQHYPQKLMLLLIASRFVLATEAVTPEERKAEFAKPRGLSKSSNTNRNSESSAQPSPISSSVSNVYQKMGEDFSKELSTLSKNFSVPKAEQEPNYLEQLEKARNSLNSGMSQNENSKASIIAQYTEAFITSLQALTQMQIDYEMSKVRSPQKNGAPAKVFADHGTLNPSPISLRTRISSSSGSNRGLFPSELDSITAKAYNPPK